MSPLEHDELYAAVHSRIRDPSGTSASAATSAGSAGAPAGGEQDDVAAARAAKKKAEKEAKATKVKPQWGDGKAKQDKKGGVEKKEQQQYVNTTVPGEKKDMSEPMAAAYEPAAVESAWEAWWDKKVRAMEFFHQNLKTRTGRDFTMNKMIWKECWSTSSSTTCPRHV